MNGITILSTIHTQMPHIKSSILLILILGCIVFSVALIEALEGGLFSDQMGIAALVALIAFVVCIVSATAVKLIEDDRYVYATIKPGTSINEVMNNYEIIDIDKDLYKLKIIDKDLYKLKIIEKEEIE